MNVVIVGIGEVGRYVANVLLEEGHNVVIIDNNRASLAAAEEMFDAMFLEGHAGSNQTLKTAEVAKADLFIAVTDHNEVNLIAAMRAKLLGAKATVARVGDPHYFDNEDGIHNDMMGIDLVINPEALLAQEMHKIVRSSHAVAVRDFAEGRIEMIQIPITEKMQHIDTPLMELDLPENTLVAALIRDERITVPRGTDTIQVGDEVLMIGRIQQIPEVERYFEAERRFFSERVMIVGGTEAGATLARTLWIDGVEVVLFEPDRDRCQVLAEELPSGVVIINGDGTNVALLEEERVDKVDAVVSVTHDDEVNIMTSLLAKDLGAKRVVALLSKPSFTHVCHHLGIDATLSPRLEMAKQVLKWVRTGEVVSISPVLEGKGEFLEFVVPEKASVLGKAIKDLDFPRGANICAVCNDNNAYVPSGSDEIHSGDRVIVFTTPDIRSDVERAFVPRRFFGLLKS